jgi:hypothetical protein
MALRIRLYRPTEQCSTLLRGLECNRPSEEYMAAKIGFYRHALVYIAVGYVCTRPLEEYKAVRLTLYRAVGRIHGRED